MRWALNISGRTNDGDLVADQAVLDAIRAFHAALVAGGSGINWVNAYIGDPNGVGSDMGLANCDPPKATPAGEEPAAQVIQEM